MLDFRQKYPQSTLLQYVDDILIASTTEEQWRQAPEGLWESLQALDYRVAAKNVESWVTQVTYLGYNLEKEKQIPSHNCISLLVPLEDIWLAKRGIC